jgi:ankyrin repeat protein
MYLLSRKDVNVNIKGQFGYTILHYVCEHINSLPLDIFKLLIEKHGADVNAQHDDNNTPLHNALFYFDPNHGGDITTLTYLLTQKDINVNITSEYGYSLLHYACNKINILPITIFELLITLGADVNVQDKDKDTPLHNALYYFNPNDGGNINVLMYLLGHENVNVNIRGQFDYTLLDKACNNINYLPLDVFKLLIETQDFDVNVEANNNNTPIYCALYCFDPRCGGDITVLNYLLNQMGVDPNIKGQFGCTLLHYACTKINTLQLDIFKLLIETMGCDVNVQAQDNDTPIHYALSCFSPNHGGDLAVLAYLINQKNLNVSIKNQNGFNLLHHACINNLSELRDCAKRNAEFDTISCQIVEVVVETCIERVLDDVTS